MKHCPSCDEILGASAETCFKCRYVFKDLIKETRRERDFSRLVCSGCGAVNYYPNKTCQVCKTPLKPQFTSASCGKINDRESELRPPPIWLFVVGILFPIVGVPLGIKYVFQRRDRSLIFVVLSFLGFLVTPTLYMMIVTYLL